ncbi:non-ribosomal peptide synthetase [Xenorhabdus bovienii]|uniref:Aminoacid racemase implied in NRPS/PKS synthesis n=1 Tax=Xenorhabdus bovienii TaxID=40576 RepID=A0A0B6X5N2_XENBV|nr:non-ribosomal peptide synthetase [Xenorhabdus bovienii]CDM88840.1 Aminoacid racemase implied in NRPS/PKS synthesis [Xenorhabdus bovienii]
MNSIKNSPRWVRNILFKQAEQAKEDIALRYCIKNTNGTQDKTEIYTYQDLLSLGCKLASQLTPRSEKQSPALLLMPGDSSFVISFIACIIRGISAIPVHLASHLRTNRSSETIDHIIEDSQPEFILTFSHFADEIAERGWNKDRQLIFVDKVIAALVDSEQVFPTEEEYHALYHYSLCHNSDAPVYLQYSSGSTAKPKAVCNYDDNMRVQHEILLELHQHCQPKIITANWLPFYHDLGMFCGLLLPLLSGGCCNFMPPVHLVSEPFRWLKIIHDYQANSVAAPDFAWELCASMVTDEWITQLDLSSVKMAMNAAEPIRAETMNRFACRFSATGFHPQSFTPAYGMAESTLVISYKPIGTDYVSRRFNAEELAKGRAIPSPDGRELISSGQVAHQWQLQIVDPETHRPLPEGQIGEIWVNGASMAGGYWQNQALTETVFKNTLAGDHSGNHYLRTGDLAFLYQGELFICGRLKDVIIVGGQNYMPNDIETVIERFCPGVKIGGICVCQDFDNGELIIMAEVYRHLNHDELDSIAKSIVAEVAKHFQLMVGNVVLLAKGKLSKTSSGKIRRRHMLSQYLAHQLEVVSTYSAEEEPVAITSSPLFDGLQQTLCHLLGIDSFNPHRGFSDAGLNSLLAVKFCQKVNQYLDGKYSDYKLRVTDLFAYPTLAQLAHYIEQHRSQINTNETLAEPKKADKEIAIIAISCRLPGQTDEHWQHYGKWLAAGQSAVRHEQSRYRRFVQPIGAINDIEKFDAHFFNIADREALLLDPQQRILLELSWHLFEQAGWLPKAVKQRDIGFYIGQSGSEYGQLLLQQNNPDYAKSYLATGINTSATSGRLAKFYGTTGPALTIDTACSSSLVALNSAMNALQQKQCSAAVVGGVNLLLSPQIEQALINTGMLSPHGRCATFSREADGYVRGEGAVLCLLKPYQQALADGDPVLAVIEGSVVAQDGESSSLTAPNPKAQAAMMTRLLTDAALTPEDISLLETHGTGTALGDPIEISAINAVYGQRKTPLRLGASKSQTGHLEAAAGLCAVVRAVAQIQQQKAFGHPTFTQCNPLITDYFDHYHFERETVSCEINRVAVNAFSFTGTMAGVVLRKPEVRSENLTDGVPSVFLPSLYSFNRQSYWPEALLIGDGDKAENQPPLPEHRRLNFDFVRSWVADTLSLDISTLSDDEDLLNLGLDSLQMLDLVDECKKLNVSLTLAKLFENTTLSAWRQYWQSINMTYRQQKEPAVSSGQWNGEPFALTSVQQAYWQGRQQGQVLGDVACQVYLELDCVSLPDSAINQAVNKLFQRHDLLRMRINEQGLAVIRDDQPVTVSSHQWLHLSDEACSAERMNLRRQLSHRMADLTQESGFQLIASHSAQGTYLHINVDMVIADAMSLQILLDELSEFIRQPELSLTPLNYNFPQYLLDQDLKNVNNTEHAAYWQQRVTAGLPLAPQLPLAVQPAELNEQKFCHRDWRLEAESWGRLKNIARRYGVTPSMLLAGCFAETLRGWAKEPDFSLNLTIFNRRGEHPELSKLVADFTSLLLLACKTQADDSILTHARRLNQQFMRDLDHADYSAVQVLRDWSQQRGEQVTMPVVFTSNLGRDLLSEKTLGTLSYLTSQTPQVWIDCQVMEHQQELLISWDTVDALFPVDMVDQMFSFMTRLIMAIVQDEMVLHAPVTAYIVPSLLALRRNPPQNEPIPPLAPRLLHQQFWHWAEKTPTNIAVISQGIALTYQEISEQVRELAWRLKDRQIQHGDHIGLLLPKGVEQIVAVLACHSVGAVYVPLDIAIKAQRLQQIISQSDIRLVIGHQEREIQDDQTDYGWLNIAAKSPNTLPIEQIVFGHPSDVAYIIFTSGSTGVPKGVVISHQSAANTVDDINFRYSVSQNNEKQRMTIFALSALNFDLSVYDIFGSLSLGGTLVLPNAGQEKEAKQWLALLHKNQVTHWNSVPALFEMLLVAAEQEPRGLPASLNQILLSGDWVGLDLLPRLRALGSGANFTALGGATEAAIWSNAIDVSAIPLHWNSIPYGYPLAHQYYRVVDNQGRDCPDWVTGELWIGGQGVGLGYYADPDKTAEQFVIQGGERFYRTGDFGRFWSDSCLEFLGRQDRQIKLHGYRIELGEIEAVAERLTDVKHAVALFLDKPQKHIQLFIEGKEQHSSRELTAPAYAVMSELPDHITTIDQRHDEKEITSHLLHHILTDVFALDFTDCQSSEVLLEKAGITAQWQPLFGAWLAWLVEQKMLECHSDRFKATARWQQRRLAIHDERLLSIHHAIEQKATWLAAVLTGNENPLLLLDDPVISPENLVAYSPDTLAMADALCQQIESLSAQLQRPVRVAELNGRSGILASYLLSCLKAESVHYCLMESAGSLRKLAEYRLAGYQHTVDVISAPEQVVFSADIVITNNALHRFNDIAQGIEALKSLCGTDSLIYAYESLTLSPLALLTVLLLQDQNGFSDQRKGAFSPLLNQQDWQQTLSDAGLVLHAVKAVQPHSMLFICQCRQAKTLIHRETLMQHLRQYLPAYMLPAQITSLTPFPLTANGKIDRNALAAQAAAVRPEVFTDPAEKAAFSDEREQCVARVWQQILGVTPQADSNFFLSGGDSLHATRIVAQLEKEGVVDVTLAQIFSLPVLRDFASSITFSAEVLPSAQLIHQPELRYAPFEPTDVQRAYLMGRQAGFHLGGVATHYYNEYEYHGNEGTAFDPTRLEKALSQLVARHDALRIVFDEHGAQRALAQQPSSALTMISCRADEWEIVTATQRKYLSHRVLEPAQWPLFHATLIQSDDGRSRFCLGLDNLILDGLSMQIFFTELAVFYANAAVDLPSVDIGFRDYLTATHLKPESENNSENYWRERLEQLPDAPRLPLVCDPKSLGTPKFKRWQSVLPAARWQKLAAKARSYQITPSCLLLTCYAQVLAKWSESAALTINVTLFDRQPCHPDINHIMGDFTSLLLLACQQYQDESWFERVQRTQQQLWQDLEHSDVSAVWVIRELNRQRGTTDVTMPVVFTSALGAQVTDYPDVDFPASIWGISQTPQVWIDHQVFEREGELHFNWDGVEALFPAQMIDQMFSAYCQLLEELADAESWHVPLAVPLPAPQQISRQQVNETRTPFDFSPLHCRVATAMQEFALRTALVEGDSVISYQQLEQAVRKLAQYLTEQGVREKDLVGIALPRSGEQIIALLAVQWLGAAYVPLSSQWPRYRREQVIGQAEIRYVISHPELTWPDTVTVLSVQGGPDSASRPEPLAVTSEDLAYIIFTSGSTGIPKGVAISHGAAVNTIEAVNRQHHLNDADRGIALSALHFDLSVWDIFGLLSVGGALIIVAEQQEKDAAAWLSLVSRHRVTVWNSVPALLEMTLLISQHEEIDDALASLRLVMLSGDWVAPALPQRLKTFAPDAQCVAMGGATEAAIWSNYCLADEWLANEWQEDESASGWRSVPYGVPLPNQSFRIVNEINEDCPDWVTGELWIGGKGVALGYFGDRERTERQFVSHQGQRWYRTDDTGRYRPGAVIEFLGRKDQQVKISGYRLELEEIQHVLKTCPDIEDALVFVTQQHDRPLLSAVVMSHDEPDWGDIMDALRQKLPEYSIPTRVGHCQRWPLTDNGKRDHQALETLLHPYVRAVETTRPLTEAEQLLCDQLKLLLDIPHINFHDNFFAIGGDSFIATRLTSALRRHHGIELPLWKIFSLQTISHIAQTIESTFMDEADIQFEEGSL